MSDAFRIPVFFRPEMVAAPRACSPSAGKPPLVVADWQAQGLPIVLCGFDPVDEATLCLAHDPAYVRGVLQGRVANGFGDCRPDIAASLPYTSGAMLAAAREAIANRRVACAPVSGFHHARFAQSSGYCTFNGLMVTALALHRDGLARQVGILDLDHHWGDGTDEIMRRRNTPWIRHHSPGRRNPGPAQAREYLDRLPTRVSSFMEGEVLLYQAGADAHVDDPLGGWMDDEQLAERDRIVFETAATIGLPVAWNLAGGYQREPDGSIPAVLAIHRRTMQACAAVHGPADAGD